MPKTKLSQLIHQDVKIEKYALSLLSNQESFKQARLHNIVKLRQYTGWGMMDCWKYLEQLSKE